MKKKYFFYIFFLLFSFLLFEISLCLLAKLNLIAVYRPSYFWSNIKSEFWVDRNPYFGVWHEPNSKYRHRKSCYDVIYKANSHGARDKERSYQSDHKRVVMLGDSFIEGYGLDPEQRLSNLLEENNHIEHLNFGTAGDFGTTQYSLLYKHLAKKFQHDAIIIGILPGNDFLDDDYEHGLKVYGHRYRPYYVGKYPNYRLVYNSERLPKMEEFDVSSTIRGFLREYTWTYNVYLYLKTSLKGKFSHQKNDYSGYYDFTDKQFDVMKYALEQIVKEADRKDVYVFTIPVRKDFIRFDKAGTPPLSIKLATVLSEMGATYIDLLPYMAALEKNREKYFYSCDGHWNAYGNRVAYNFLKESIALYK